MGPTTIRAAKPVWHVRDRDDGAMLMPYEKVIDPPAVQSRPALAVADP